MYEDRSQVNSRTNLRPEFPTRSLSAGFIPDSCSYAEVIIVGECAPPAANAVRCLLPAVTESLDGVFVSIELVAVAVAADYGPL